MTRFMVGGAAALVALALCATPTPAQCSFSLKGDWRGNDGGTYRLGEFAGTVSWVGQSADGGRSWTNRFRGKRDGQIISGNWADVAAPHGRGTLTLRLVDDWHIVRVSSTGSGFGGTRWSRPRQGCNDSVGIPADE